MKFLFSCSALVAGLFALELVPAFAQTTPLELASPDHQLVLHFGTKPSPGAQSGKLLYSATFRGKPILDDSALGLELADQPAKLRQVHHRPDIPLGPLVTVFGQQAPVGRNNNRLFPPGKRAQLNHEASNLERYFLCHR